MGFVVGDYLAGASIGALTALGVRALVSPGMDMVLGMLLGMAVGSALHVVLGLVLAPLLGMFHIMATSLATGMYGGMLFGMRDSMGAGSDTWQAALGVGALFGALVVLAVKAYDWSIRGPVIDPDR